MALDQDDRQVRNARKFTRMLNTVVCDDEVPALELMSGLLAETGDVSIAASCQSVQEALDVINRGGIDLVVFDIEMPELSGVDAYSRITAVPRPLVVFANMQLRRLALRL